MNVSSTSNTQRIKAVLKTKSVTQYDHSCCSPTFKKALELYIREKSHKHLPSYINAYIFFFFYFSQLCGITKALAYFSAPDFATFAKIY